MRPYGINNVRNVRNVNSPANARRVAAFYTSARAIAASRRLNLPARLLISAVGASCVTIVGIQSVSRLNGTRELHCDNSREPEPKAPKEENGSPGFPHNLLSFTKVETNDQAERDVSVSDETQRNNTTFVSTGLSFLRSSLPVDTITNLTSSWSWPASLTSLQAKVSALMLEYSAGPGSLYDEVVNTPPDAALHPECGWDAHVRLGDELCLPERAFLRQRKRRMRKDFAKLMGVSEAEVEVEDIPTVAFACSGGGFRAMFNTVGSLVAAKSSGLFDVSTYISGISGSCWALATLYSGIVGENDPSMKRLVEHLQDRVSTSYLDMATLDILTTPPTNKYLLSGLMRKASAPGSEVSLVDLYGTLISSRLFIPSDIKQLDPHHLSLHRFRRLLDSSAQMPLPVLTAVRHEIPLQAEQPLKEVKAEKEASVDEDMKKRLGQVEKAIESVSSWLWFEWTPYEMGCDELGAWIPTWSLGRRFDKGKSIERRPELSLTIISGIVSSAFCATLQDYFMEVQPLLRTLPSSLYSWLADVVSSRENHMEVTHAVLPDELPNFVKNLDGLREGSPVGITDRDTLGFMDAGALLNVPYYPLLRRNVDCIIALDASADSQDIQFKRAEEYALRKGLTTWPKGTGWPTAVTEGENGSEEELAASSADATRHIAKIKERELAGQTAKQEETEVKSMPNSVARSSSAQPSPSDTDNPNRGLAEEKESELAGQATKQADTEGKRMPDAAARSTPGHPSRDDAPSTTAVPPPISGCTVWIGSSEGDDSTSRFDDLDEETLATRDGVGIVYIPQLPNEDVPGFDPLSISTFRFEIQREESEKLIRLGQANFEAGKDKIIKLLRVMWLRKKRSRLERQQKRIV